MPGFLSFVSPPLLNHPRGVKTSEARLADFVARVPQICWPTAKKMQREVWDWQGRVSSSWQRKLKLGKRPQGFFFSFTWALYHPWCFASCNDKWQLSTIGPISEKKRLSCLAFLGASIADRSFFNCEEMFGSTQGTPASQTSPPNTRSEQHISLRPPPLHSFCVVSSALAAGARRSLHV